MVVLLFFMVLVNFRDSCLSLSLSCPLPDAWAGPEHKEREGNAEFSKTFFSTGMSGNMLEDMNGGYTGKIWHLERQGASKTEPVYMVKMLAKAKDASAAERLISASFTQGAKEFAADEGMLRFTVLPTGEIGMMGPLPKDDVTVVWLKAWKSLAEYEAHKKAGHVENMQAVMKEMDCEAEVTVLEFADTQHFSK